jgi:hypothetical protein
VIEEQVGGVVHVIRIVGEQLACNHLLLDLVGIGRRERNLSARTDPRPRIIVPASDQDWLPQMSILNDVLGASRASKPPARNMDGTTTRARKLSLPNMHTFAKAQSDPTEQDTT